MYRVRTYRWLVVFLIVFAAGAVDVLAANKPPSVWIMDRDGSSPRQLIRLEGYDYHRMPRWSHNGKQVAFYAANKIGFAHEVFIMNADGSDPHKVGGGDCPDWSADDKQLLFDTWNAPDFIAQAMNVDGSGCERLGEGSCPRWSPDGARMVVIRKMTTPVVIDLRNDQELALFDAPMANIGEAVAWSPDGNSLALFAQPNAGGPMQLLIMSAADPSADKQVRLRQVTGSVLNYSPDGKQLIFDALGLIYLVDIEGTDPPRVLPGQMGHNRDAQISPDDKQIIFVSNRDEK